MNTSLTKAKRKLSSAIHVDIDEIEEIEDENINAVFVNLARGEQKKLVQYLLSQMDMEDNLLLTLYYLNENSIERNS